MTLDRETVERYRTEASEDLERRAANTTGATPSLRAQKMLLDPKDGRIVALADTILDDESPTPALATVWVLDQEGYDVRGGNAEVFSTVELAKARVGPPSVSIGAAWSWYPTEDGAWEQRFDDDPNGTWESYTITPKRVDS